VHGGNTAAFCDVQGLLPQQWYRGQHITCGSSQRWHFCQSDATVLVRMKAAKQWCGDVMIL